MKVIYIDMDGVLADIKKDWMKSLVEKPYVKYPQSVPSFFENLTPVKGAIESVNLLRRIKKYDVWILTAPSVKNPLCYTEKRLWIEKHFDYEFCKRLIICNDKSLLRGHYLIDDNLKGKGQENFLGEVLHFGCDFIDWEDILKYLNNVKINR